MDPEDLEYLRRKPEACAASSSGLYRPPDCSDLHFWLSNGVHDLVQDVFYEWKIMVFPDEVEPGRKMHPLVYAHLKKKRWGAEVGARAVA